MQATRARLAGAGAWAEGLVALAAKAAAVATVVAASTKATVIATGTTVEVAARTAIVTAA